MNQYMEGKWSWIEGTHKQRMLLLDSLSDADLAFNPGGKNMTLGELFRELGEIEYSYLQSIKTLKQEWSYRNTDPAVTTAIAPLRAWFQQLDDDLKATVSAFSDDDMQKIVERGQGFAIPIETQLDIYLQALLIFFGKVTIFIRSMDRALPGDLQEWVG